MLRPSWAFPPDSGPSYAIVYDGFDECEVIAVAAPPNVPIASATATSGTPNLRILR